jgi:hypothetical protein
MGIEWSERAVASGGQAVRRSAKDNPLVGKFAETQTISATEGRTVSQKITSSGIQDVDSFLGIEKAAIYVLKLTTGFPLSSQENLDGSLQNGHQHLEWRKAEPSRRVKDIALTSPSMYLMLSILSTIFVIAWGRRGLHLRCVRPESRLLSISCAHPIGTYQAPHGFKEVVQNSVTPKVSVDKQQLRSGESAVTRNQHNRNIGR